MEAIYQYAWKHRLCGRDLTLDDGRKVRIISPGILNKASGPDFSNAMVECEGTRWCGNIEVHTRASDWHRHNHSADRAYDNVILHVVAVSDTTVNRHDGTPIPQVEIELSQHLIDSIEALVDGLDALSCNSYLKRLDRFTHMEWIQSLGVERMQQKAAQLESIFRWSDNDWSQTLFVMLSRSLGFGINSDPMEMLARSIPLNFLLRHSDNYIQIEAMLFGVAGLLNPNLLPQDEYYQWLCREYKFLAAKYSLRPLDPSVWKAGTRPGNSPHRRIAALAKFVEGGFKISNEIREYADDLLKLCGLFRVSVSPYWLNHYSFGTSVKRSLAVLSDSSIDVLIINMAVPYIYLYGLRNSNTRLENQAMSLLERLPPERNGVVRSWSGAGIFPQNAFQSQALLYLKREYCNRDRCCDCRFGHRYLHQVADMVGEPEFEWRMSH